MDTRSISKAFTMMVPRHILDDQMHVQTMNLVMFARSKIIKWNDLKPNSQPKSWKDLKKTPRTNSTF